MAVVEGSQGAFRMLASVPDDMVSLPVDGEWAVWLGAATAVVGDRRAVLMVSITITAFTPPEGIAADEALAEMLQAQHPDSALIEEFEAGGHPAVEIRLAASVEVSGRAVATGQVQAFVVFPVAGALGVVSGACFHPDDLDRAAGLVTGIASRLSVEAVAAAA